MSITDRLRIANPHNPGSPARMSDGRLFTEYRGACQLLPTGAQGTDPATMFDTRSNMMYHGELYRSTDRDMALARAERRGEVVDTMVPESSKRVYTWAGPSIQTAHPIGIGMGRMYLPGQQGLIQADPDTLAAATVPWLGWTTPSYRAGSIPATAAKRNMYAAPYY